MKYRHLMFAAATLMLLFGSVPALALPVLGSVEDFAVLGHTGVSNTGPTVVFGSASTLANVGVFEAGANAVVGFSTAGNTFYGPGTFTDGPGIVNAPAAIHGGDGVALLARNDLITAWNALASYGTATDMTGEDLGNYHSGALGALAPGVYGFDSSVGITGTLELDAGGLDGVSWVFQVGTDLTTASASAVRLINAGPNGGADVGVYWVLGTSETPGLGSATLGTTTAFEGNILALTSITLTTGATIYNGRALAINGAVTLDTNVISDICPSQSELPDNVTGSGSSSPNSGPGFSGGLGLDEQGELYIIPLQPPSSVPEPGSLALIGAGLAGFWASRKRMRSAYSSRKA